MASTLGGTMRLAMSRHGSRSPSLPRVPSSPGGTSARHGSAEQATDVFGRPADWMGPTPPMHSANGSPSPSQSRSGNEDDSRREDREERRARQAEDRERRNADPSEPIGMGFRLNAVETSIRDHTNELAAQKILLQQIVEAVKDDAGEKKKLQERLDMSFTQSNEKHAQHEKELELVKQRSDLVTSTVNASAGTIAQRLDELTQEFEKWKQSYSNDARSPQARTMPATPQSWSHPGHEATGGANQPGANQRGSCGGTNLPTGFGPQQPTTSNSGFGQFTSAQGVRDPPPSGTPQFPNSSGPNNNVSSNRGYFGGNSAGTTYHNMSPPAGQQWSPLSGHQGPEAQRPTTWDRTTQNARFGQWAPGAGTEQKEFDARDWSLEGKKASKELKAFDGNALHYDNWRRRLRDHFISTNCNYTTVFSLVESCKMPISWSTLASIHIPELPHMNWQWISTHVWTITGGFLSDTQLNRRTDLTCGEEFNGLELWRALFNENCGGSAEMGKTERSYFINFPKCEKTTELRTHMGQWCQMKQKYGAGLPMEHLIIMFQDILPDQVKEDVKRQRDAKDNLQMQIDYVYGELDTYNDSQLSKLNISKLKDSLKPKVKLPTSINVLGAEQQVPETVDVPRPPVPDMASFQANIERMVNAAFDKNAKGRDRGRDTRRTPPGSRSSSNGSKTGGGGRKAPNPKFEGCWCCGDKDHSRADCPKWKAIKAKNDGKIPKDYVGAYEKSLKPRTKVAAVTKTDFEETVKIWPVMRLPKPVQTSNTFSGLSATDDDDRDESDVVKALSQLTSNVVFASEKSRSQKAKKKDHEVHMNFVHLNAIAKDVKDGKITLPELDLSSDSEYMYIWALVDSGAGANVARKEHFPSSRKVLAPAISLTGAGGDDLPNRGAMEITTMNKNGTPKTRVFYDADVEMPILSVAELSQEGQNGSDVQFRRKDGFIQDLESGHREMFVKRKGVYFTKMYVLKPRIDAGFTRPA